MNEKNLSSCKKVGVIFTVILMFFGILSFDCLFTEKIQPSEMMIMTVDKMFQVYLNIISSQNVEKESVIQGNAYIAPYIEHL